MNLIDFEVTEIISEEKDKVWKLLGYTEEELEKENTKTGKCWYEYLLGDGVKQEYKYVDMGGELVSKDVFNLSIGQKPYYVGYKGQH